MTGHKLLPRITDDTKTGPVFEHISLWLVIQSITLKTAYSILKRFLQFIYKMPTSYKKCLDKHLDIRTDHNSHTLRNEKTSRY